MNHGLLPFISRGMVSAIVPIVTPKQVNDLPWHGDSDAGVGETLGDARSCGVDEIADGLRPKKKSHPQWMARVLRFSIVSATL